MTTTTLHALTRTWQDLIARPVRAEWAALSTRRRRLWIAVLLWCALHLLGFALAPLLMSDFTRDNVKDWSDIGVYVTVGEQVYDHQTPYTFDDWDNAMTYPYHPLFAVTCIPLAAVPFQLLPLLWILLQGSAYVAALVVWYRVVVRLGWAEGARAFRLWLPLAFVFSEWYANLMYGNIVSSLMLLSGLMVLGFVTDRPALSGVAAAIILVAKPHWLFPLMLPLIFRRWGFFARMMGVLLAVYLLENGLLLLAMGPSFGLELLDDYVRFLTTVQANYPYDMGTGVFENMNHSWPQIFYSYFGDRAWIPGATVVVRLVVLALPGLLILRAWRQRVTVADHPPLVVWFAGLSYLSAFAMLAQLWEVMASIVFFFAVQAAAQPRIRRWSRLYLVYALFEFQVIGAALWQWLFLPQSIPLTMLALLLLFGCLLWMTHAALRRQAAVRPAGAAPPELALRHDDRAAPA